MELEHNQLELANPDKGMDASVNDFAHDMMRQLGQSEAKRQERQRLTRKGLGLEGEQWDSLVSTWLNLRYQKLTTLWEYAATGSRVADGFGDDALDHFAAQVGAPARMVHRGVETYRQSFVEVEPTLSTLHTSESGYVRDLRQRLIARGFVARREVELSFGRADIVASIPEDKRHVSKQIIEAKLSADWRAAAQALGQLLFYQGAIPDGVPSWQLWFASPDRPEDRVLKMLEHHGVGWIA